MNPEISEKQSDTYLAAAMLAPLAQASSGCSWPVIFLLSALCLGAAQWLSCHALPQGKFLKLLQSLWTCVLGALVLQWISDYWPGHRENWVAPLILLALAAGIDKNRAIRVACILLYPVLFLLGTIYLSAVPEMEPWQLIPRVRMTNMDIVPFFLLPALERGAGGRKPLWKLMLFAVAASAVSLLANTTKAPVYELSRNISLFGTGWRFESLASVAMTLGFFTALSYLMAAGSGTGKTKWGKAVITALLYLWGIPYNSQAIAIGTVILFLIIPAVMTLQNFWRKKEKTS